MPRMHAVAPRAGLALAATLLAATSGCTTAAPPPSQTPTTTTAPTVDPGAPDTTTELGTVPAPIPTDAVAGLGLVLDAGTPILCLGDVGASLPPVCGGEPLVGWDWESLGAWESRGGTRWGSYRVVGTWDGERLTVTSEPISLAIIDPVPVDPTGPAPGTTLVDEQRRIQQVLLAALGDRALSAALGDGYVLARVVYDDGTIQQHLDDVYGPGVVHVESALLPAS